MHFRHRQTDRQTDTDIIAYKLLHLALKMINCHISANLWPILTTLCHMTCFRARMCLLGVALIIHPILEVRYLKYPILELFLSQKRRIFKLSCDQSCCSDFNQILPSDKTSYYSSYIVPKWRTAVTRQATSCMIASPTFNLMLCHGWHKLQRNDLIYVVK